MVITVEASVAESGQWETIWVVAAVDVHAVVGLVEESQRRPLRGRRILPRVQRAYLNECAVRHEDERKREARKPEAARARPKPEPML